MSTSTSVVKTNAEKKMSSSTTLLKSKLGSQCMSADATGTPTQARKKPFFQNHNDPMSAYAPDLDPAFADSLIREIDAKLKIGKPTKPSDAAFRHCKKRQY
eukprot:Opistho-2@65253